MDSEILKQYLELGGIAGLFALFITQYFQTQRSKKDPLNGTGKAILQELQTQNGNHLEHIQQGITDGFKELQNSIHTDNMKIVELLGEIKGNLNK
jgi:hypothetical protein